MWASTPWATCRTDRLSTTEYRPSKQQPTPARRAFKATPLHLPPSRRIAPALKRAVWWLIYTGRNAVTRLIGQASKRSRPEVAPGSNPRQYHFRRHAAATDPDSRETHSRTREITSTRTLTPAKDIENTRSPENTKVQTTLTSASTWTTLKNCRTLLYRCHHITKHSTDRQ